MQNYIIYNINGKKGVQLQEVDITQRHVVRIRMGSMILCIKFKEEGG